MKVLQRIVISTFGLMIAMLASAGCASPANSGALPLVTVYASPTCGCCSKWMSHLRSAGFRAQKTTVELLAPIKRDHGVPSSLNSCHTAVVDGYVIEGHVPVDDIRRLLDERPAVVGIAVPDMPLGSPGMEVPGRPAQKFDVLSFDDQGQIAIFARH